jgi:uncharacterized phage-associated protein
MKIQKLVYFANGWHLAVKGDPLIDEQVEAWTFGPVILSLYGAFRKSGGRPITASAVRRDSDFQIVGVHDLGDVPDQARFTNALLDRIWAIYGGYSAIQLSNETHRSGSPWDTVFKHYKGTIPKGTDIPANLMRKYFRSLASAQ